MARGTSTPAPTSVEAETYIAADPVHLYELVSDVTNMGRWSPETTKCKWLKGAIGPVVGAKFRGSNKAAWRRWQTTSTVVAADPGERFAFDVGFGPVNIARWTYEFHAEGEGTRVVERWDDRRPKSFKKPSAVVMNVPDRPEHNREGMVATLANLKAAVEQQGA